MTIQGDTDLEKRLLAAALYELRVMLAHHLDWNNPAPDCVAARFAYVLHNQALATLEGRPFEVEGALAAVDAMEPILGSAYVRHFRRVVLGGE